MSNIACDHNAWLHLTGGTGGKSDFGLGYENRYERVIDQLPKPSERSPSLAFFLGRKWKNAALDQIFPHNNLKRRRCAQGSVRLEVDKASAEEDYPILFADADPNLPAITQDQCHSSCYPRRVVSLPRAAAVPHLVQDIVLNRLLFLFTDVVCLFADDVGGLDGVKTLLTTWATIGSASSLPSTVRPRLLIISQEDQSSATYNLLEREDFRYDLLHDNGVDLSQIFASIKAIVLPGQHLSPLARHLRLRRQIAREFGLARRSRAAASATFSGTHQKALFNSALTHISCTIEKPFDFVHAAREGNELDMKYSSHVENFLTLCEAQTIPIDTVCSFVASSILMNAYPPGMHMFSPVVLFHALYRSHISHAARQVYDDFRRAEHLCQSIEDQLVGFYNDLLSSTTTSRQIHRENLARYAAQFAPIKTNLTCLLCLNCPPEHPMQCSHAFCDKCVRIFGDGMVGFQDRYVLPVCMICQLRSALMVQLIPSTAGIRILSIDGGGSHAVISLKWLAMLQDFAGPKYAVQDFFDLSIGTSAGGLIVLSLIVCRWNVTESTRLFKSLARRIFAREPNQSIADKARQLLRCWVSDGFYNAQVLEDVLKEVFGTESRMFGYRPLVSSGPKAAVTATTTKGSTAFVIANYNGPGERGDDCGYIFGRPACVDHEALVWQAARATSAAPVYFKPTQVSMVGLQDGCLEHPNPAELAVWESHRIWPEITRPDVVLSLGNGTTAGANPLKAEFVGTLFNGFMSRLYTTIKSRIDPEKAWARLWNGLDDKAKQNYIRLNVEFPGAEPAIDDVDCMEELSRCVVTKPHAARVLRAFRLLLVSSLYLELDAMPTNENGVYHCKGSIRCRSGSFYLIRALAGVHEGVMEFYNDGDSLGCHVDEIDICAVCCCYRRPVNFRVSSLTHKITLSVKGGKYKGRNLSAMPKPIAWYIKKQSLQSPFGSATHGDPGALRCQACSPNPSPHHIRATEGKRKRPDPTVPQPPRKRALRH